MLASLLSAMLLMSAPGTTLWFDAGEADAAVQIQEEGRYTVWAWVAVDSEARIAIGEREFSIRRKKPSEGESHQWQKLGSLALQPGKLSLQRGDAVLAVVLSTVDGFEPASALKDMRVYDEPRAISDLRAKTAKHTNTVFTMPHFTDKDTWEAYATRLRRRILLSSGLLPLPERSPLNVRIFDRIVHEDYTIEKASFESRPGLWVTGNLYRPVGKGPFPGVVCPHGHWEHGRIEDGKRGSVPARCITLARLGAVVFSYDMIGYNDSLQLSHRWGGEREKLWGVHPFAMQLWNSIRAVDFLESLPDVDAMRLACTGASGGGTQTFALTAVDARIKVAAPVNMISSRMQGGCLCENAPILRLDNSNMEIGALAAPRPLLMVSASGDWTRETPRVEYPAIQSIYALYGAAAQVENVHIDAGHNYNRDSREAMYRFFGKWLFGRDDMAEYVEPPYSLERDEDMRLFPDGKLPAEYARQEEVIEKTIAGNRKRWAALLPENQEEATLFKAQHGGVLRDVLGVEVPAVNAIVPERVSVEERREAGYVLERWIIRRPAAGDAIPALFYRAYGPAPQDTVLLVHSDGKACFANKIHGGPGALVQSLIDAGKAVLCIDTFLTGEHHAPGKRMERMRVGDFMDTFQPTDTGYRVQDILTAMAFLRARRDLTENIALAGLGDAGVWALLAAAIDGDLSRVLVDFNGFNPDDDKQWVERHYIPCIRSVGDIQTALALIAPIPVTLMDASSVETLSWRNVESFPHKLDENKLLQRLR